MREREKSSAPLALRARKERGEERVEKGGSLFVSVESVNEKCLSRFFRQRELVAREKSLLLFSRASKREQIPNSGGPARVPRRSSLHKLRASRSLHCGHSDPAALN